MNYDYTLSDSVSLSRILDQFIIDNESPEVIVNFLKLHNTSFNEIIDKSLYATRIFQLDFIYKCNEQCIDYIFRKLSSIDDKYAMYLVWQICKKETSLPISIKNKFKSFTNSQKHHVISPYAHRATNSVQAIDIVFFNACNNRQLVDVMCRLSNAAFKDYIDHIDGSLFKYRFLQYDVFSGLTDIQKLMFLKNCYANTSLMYYHADFSSYKKFIYQILDSGEHTAIKYEAYKFLATKLFPPLSYDDMLMRCSSFSELLLRMSIEGIAEDYTYIIQKLLIHRRFDILEGWIEYDETGFNEAFNISDLVKSIIELKAQKAA